MRALVKNTGVVFNALASRDHQLEGLIVNGERTFHAAAAGSQAFADGFQALPRLRAQLAHGAERNRQIRRRSPTRSSTNSARPSVQLSKLLNAAKPFAPEFDSFLTSLGPLTKAAQQGPARRQEIARPDRTGARKPAPGAAQPRPVPAVHRRVRTRAAGLLRQPDRRVAGQQAATATSPNERRPSSTC